MASIQSIYKEIRDSAMNNWVGGSDPEAVGDGVYNILARYLEIDAHTRLLDFGCGVGRVLLAVLKYKPAVRQIVGIDIMPRVIEFCDRHIASEFPQVSFEVLHGANDHYDEFISAEVVTRAKDREQLAAEYASRFSAAYAISVFTHLELPDYRDSLELASALVEPGGRWLFTAFLLTPYSRRAIELNECLFQFNDSIFENDGSTFIGHATDRLAFVAYDLSVVEKMVFDAGFVITHIEHGAWTGSGFSSTLQDVIVCRKPVAKGSAVSRIQTVDRAAVAAGNASAAAAGNPEALAREGRRMAPFVMVGHPRSGSTLLRELLIQHPEVQMFSELFHPLEAERRGTHAIEVDGRIDHYSDETEDVFHFLDRMVWNPENSARFRAIGFKLFARYVQATGTAKLFARLKSERPDVRIIHLVRHNLLDSWVSTKLAERSGVWKISVHSDRSNYDGLEPFRADPWEVKEHFEFSRMMTDFFRRHFGSGIYLELDYDRLTGDTDRTLNSVFDFLDVSPLLVETPLQKQNRRPHREILTNFKELAEFFANSEFAHFFESGPAAAPPDAGRAKAWQPVAAANAHPSAPVATNDERRSPASAPGVAKPSFANLQAAASSLGIHRWLNEVGQAMADSSQRELLGVRMPTAPPAELQRLFVGSSGEQSVQEAGVFYRYVHEVLARHGMLSIDSLLDFGCGWGRLTRLFLRDVPQQRLFGVDPNVWGIEACRLHVPQASFIQTHARPPLPFRDGLFDVVVAYSVFSHLTEDFARDWVAEIARVLRPGGMFIGSTHSIDLLDQVRRLRDGSEQITCDWHRKLARSFEDTVAARQAYERGGFLFADTGDEHTPSYGDAIVSPGHVREVWGRILESIEFVSDRNRLPQAVFVLRKPAAA